MDGFSLIGVDAWDRRFLWLERTASRGHNNGLAFKALAVARADAERRRLGVPQDLQGLDHFPIMEGWVKGLDLLEQGIDNPARTLAESPERHRSVFRIKLRALAARLRQNIDQMGFDIKEAKLEHSKEPGRPSADNNDVVFILSLIPCSGLSSKRSGFIVALAREPIWI